MLISEVVLFTGISGATLRYYEKIGLIPKVPRNNNGVREFNEKYLNLIMLIQELKSMGMSLETIANYFQLIKSENSNDYERKELLMKEYREIINKLEAMQLMVQKANYHLENYENTLLLQRDRKSVV